MQTFSPMTNHPLTEYRDAHRLTLAELAERLGVRRWTVHGIETGRRKPSPRLAAEIEKVTGVPKSALRPDIWTN